MGYSFEFSMKGFLYYESGSKTREEARSKLDGISESHCNNSKSAVGKIFRLEPKKFSVLEEYKISLRGKELIMKNLHKN